MSVRTAFPSSPTNSEELATRAANGDKVALTYLFEKHDGHLEQFAYRRVTSRHVAEDVAAATWLRVHANIDRYVSKGEGSFCAWLFKIALRVVLDEYRDQQRRPTVVPDMLLLSQACPSAGPHEQVEAKERAQLVVDALDALTEKQRECITLRYYEDLSEAETAAVMGVSVGAVKQYQQRARRAMRKSLGPVILLGLDGKTTSVSPYTDRKASR